MEPKYAAIYSPKAEKSLEMYRGFEECCAALYKTTGKEMAKDLPIILPEDFIEKLESQGFRKFAPLACSDRALVLETSQGQVMRLQFIVGSTDKMPRSAIHEQVQSIIREVTDIVAIEVLPKLNTDVSQADEAQLRSHLTTKDYWAKDLSSRKGDLGYLPDGTIVAVDKDGIDHVDGKHFNPETDADWVIVSDQESIFPYLRGTGLISKQEYFYPALRDGRVRGVLSDADIERLKAGELETLRQEKPECFDGVTQENLGNFIHLVKDEGWYPSQAMQIMRQQNHGAAGQISPSR